MSIHRYTAAQNAAASPREVEIRAFRYVNGLLAGAADFAQRIAALHKASQLWSILVGDLTIESNALPIELKAQLISLGLWAQREAAARMADEESLGPLIALHRDMIAGLEGQVALPPPVIASVAFQAAVA
jgi:flagellar protein FlaF